MFQSQKCLTLAEFWAFNAVHTFQARAAGSELYVGGSCLRCDDVCQMLQSQISLTAHC